MKTTVILFMIAAAGVLAWLGMHTSAQLHGVQDSVDQIERSVADLSGGLSRQIREQPPPDDRAPASQTEAGDVGFAGAGGPLELRTLKDLERLVVPSLENGSVQELARACAEVDTWMFSVEQEPVAGELIEKYLTVLRLRLLDAVERLDAKALVAESGRDADSAYSEGSALLQLYPVPSSEADRVKFQNVLRRRAEVGRRINELRSLRYNKWAIQQIEQGFLKFHENLRVFDENEENANLINTTGGSLAEINPDFLSAATLELYMSLVRLTNEQIDEPGRIELAKRLVDPSKSKKSLADF